MCLFAEGDVVVLNYPQDRDPDKRWIGSVGVVEMHQYFPDEGHSYRIHWTSGGAAGKRGSISTEIEAVLLPVELFPIMEY